MSEEEILEILRSRLSIDLVSRDSAPEDKIFNYRISIRLCLDGEIISEVEYYK